MASSYAELSHIDLQAGTGFRRPPEVPKPHRLDSPALEFMTDFQEVEPITVNPETAIDDALEKMKDKGVRMLLVTDVNERVVSVERIPEEVAAEDEAGEDDGEAGPDAPEAPRTEE